MSTLDKVMIDPVEFISRLVIKDKAGKRRLFGDVITPEQIKIVRTLQHHKRVIIVKSRQLGISTLVRAYSFWKALTSPESINVAVVSNKHQSSLALLDIDRRFYTNLPKILQRQLATDSFNRIEFASNGTNLLAMTAKSDSQDRGYTLNIAHLSEFAFYSNADVYLASLIASINDGQVIIESTPAHYDDAMHRIVQAANYDTDEAPWEVVFLPWSSFPGYRADADGLVPNAYEQEIITRHNLDLEQIAWRRKRIAEMQSESLFRKEYPLTIEEAWTLDDGCYFESEDLAQFGAPYPANHSTREQIFAPPRHGFTYSLGVDPAQGTGGDYSVATVMCKSTHNVVAKISSNALSISDFSMKVIELARKYNGAMICFELNNHGHAFKAHLDFNGYYNYFPYLTTQASKIALYDQLRTAIKDRSLANVDTITLTELKALQVSQKGNAPTHASGMHDDQVISLALALEGLKQVQVPVDTWTQQMKLQQERMLATRQHSNSPLSSLRY